MDKNKINFNYYYGRESEQFSFFRVPKVLFTDPSFKNLSSDAKILYGILLDRMELSMKNGWVDKHNRIFIYFTIESIMETMNWGKGKAVKTLSELDNIKGIGLVEKKRQGQGKPTKIYVKNFIVENIKNTSRSPKTELLEVQKSNFKNSKNQTSRSPKIELLEVQKSDCNDTDTSNTDINDTEYQSINLSINNKNNNLNKKNDGLIDKNYNAKEELYRKTIQRNIDYEIFKKHKTYPIDDIDNIIDLMVDICMQETGTVNINKNQIPVEIVKSNFFKITSEHIEYILESLNNNPSDIKNIRNYLLTTIYNSVHTIDQYYRGRVNHDMSEYGKYG